jgi:zinc protease
VLKLAQEHFGKIAAPPLPPRKLPVEAEQRGIKRLTVKASAQLPYLLMAYHAPTLQKPEQDWEPYALDVLSGVLDGHASARLNKALVQEQQVASSVGAGYDLIARGTSMFQLDGTPVEGKTVADLEAAIRVQIEKVKQDGVTEEELQRVKAQTVANRVYQRDSMFYQAMMIGQFETSGLSYQALDTVLEKIKAVTAGQVREVARKYLVDDHLTVAVLDPQPLDAINQDNVKPAMPPKGGRHAN